MKLSSLARNVSLLSVLVPAFFALQHVGPDGFPSVLACIGGAPGGAGVAPEPRASIQRGGLDAATVQVATDGFFLVDVFAFYQPPAPIVEVTTENGAIVAGSLKKLPTSVAHLYGWSADAPLTIGTKLKVVARMGEYDAADTASFEVVAPPAELDAGLSSIVAWNDYAHGVGPLVTCNIAGNSCLGQPREQQLPGDEQLLHAASFMWQAAEPIQGFVAWEIRAERKLLPAAEDALASPAAALWIGAPDVPLQLGLLPFTSGDPDYCAEITVRDLRTEREVTTELCEQPGPSVGEVTRDFSLVDCTSPPSTALTEAWCKLHPGSSVQQCLPYDPTVQPSEPQPRDDNMLDADGAGSRTSSGCQMAPGTAQHAPFAVVAAVALGGLVRRRRAAR